MRKGISERERDTQGEIKLGSMVALLNGGNPFFGSLAHFEKESKKNL